MRCHHRSLGLALLVFLIINRPFVLLSHFTSDSRSPAPPFSKHQVVNVIVAGATGDLAAKYLWVALFRLALQAASTTGRTYRFIAGASDTLERGRGWHKKFFDDMFAQRVCRAVGGQEQLSTAQKCREFLEGEFIPSVRYTPLREESHYRELGQWLNEMNELLPSEEGRMVYLAIPPQFFLQSCELIHRYLRPRSTESQAAPFLRVVVEKPFGRDLKSAHELATQLRAIYNNDELYVMDHYAGKPVVHALRSYFRLNAAALHPVWNTEHIDNIHIEMTETATLQNRVHYFDNAGIIRDVMVNHLQLLLSVAVTPSFNTGIFSGSISPAGLHDAQLTFVEALKTPLKQPSVLIAQYDEYATHYKEEMGRGLDASDHFTPTAAMIEFTSSSDEWKNTTFRLAAAKATDARLLAITITFRDGVFVDKGAQPCSFIVIIQQALNADTRQSHRIEWSCDVSDALGDLKHPNGWEYLYTNDYRVITPMQANRNAMEQGQEAVAWELGDEPSAYDILLREVYNGATEHFADLDEVEAAWALWTSVVQAAESNSQHSVPTSDATAYPPQSTLLQYTSYPAGTSPWQQVFSSSQSTDRSPTAREEL
ncbi:hypothetical protein PRIC1_010742 [Phytophthora ramorum]